MWAWILLVVLLLIIYPLSFGPFVWLVQQHDTPGVVVGIFAIVYTPLYLVCQSSESMMGALQWYGGLWMPQPEWKKRQLQQEDSPTAEPAKY